jgi:hypothetical protein
VADYIQLPLGKEVEEENAFYRPNHLDFLSYLPKASPYGLFRQEAFGGESC